MNSQTWRTNKKPRFFTNINEVICHRRFLHCRNWHHVDRCAPQRVAICASRHSDGITNRSHRRSILSSRIWITPCYNIIKKINHALTRMHLGALSLHTSCGRTSTCISFFFVNLIKSFCFYMLQRVHIKLDKFRFIALVLCSTISCK